MKAQQARQILMDAVEHPEKYRLQETPMESLMNLYTDFNQLSRALLQKGQELIERHDPALFPEIIACYQDANELAVLAEAVQTKFYALYY